MSRTPAEVLSMTSTATAPTSPLPLPLPELERRLEAFLLIARRLPRS